MGSSKSLVENRQGKSKTLSRAEAYKQSKKWQMDKQIPFTSAGGNVSLPCLVSPLKQDMMGNLTEMWWPFHLDWQELNQPCPIRQYHDDMQKQSRNSNFTNQEACRTKTSAFEQRYKPSISMHSKDLLFVARNCVCKKGIVFQGRTFLDTLNSNLNLAQRSKRKKINS